MNRKINLVFNESQNINDLENLSFNNLDSIFSYSCELLICKFFNVFDESVATQAFTVLFDKLRPQGQLVLGTINHKQICTDYIHKKIDNKEFFTHIKGCSNHFGYDDIISIASSLPNAMVIDIKNDKYNNYVTLTKTKP